MLELYKLLISILFLLLGFPLGNYLAKLTKDEKKQGQKWFKIIIFASLISGIASLILKNDALFFSFFFIALVTSRSLKR